MKPTKIADKIITSMYRELVVSRIFRKMVCRLWCE